MTPRNTIKHPSLDIMEDLLLSMGDLTPTRVKDGVTACLNYPGHEIFFSGTSRDDAISQLYLHVERDRRVRTLIRRSLPKQPDFLSMNVSGDFPPSREGPALRYSGVLVEQDMLPIPEDDIIPETIKIPDTITSADTSSHHNSRNLPRVFLSNDGKCSLTFDTAETIKALIAPYTSLGDFSFTYECVVGNKTPPSLVIRFRKKSDGGILISRSINPINAADSLVRKIEKSGT